MINKLKSLDWGDKSFYRRLIYLSLPIIGQEFLNALVNILDSFMVGTLGLSAINGVGFGNQIFFLFFLILFGINSGSAMFMGQFWGKGDVKSIHKVMGITFTSSSIVAVFFIIGSLLIPEVLIGFYSSDAAVIKEGSTYLRTVSPVFLIAAIVFAVNAALRSIGQTKMPMATTLVALVCNATLNYIFIFILKWGVFGTALATAIARSIELAAQIFLINAYKMPVATKIREYFRANWIFVKDFYKLTTPVIINEFVWALGTTIYNVAYKGCGNESQGSVQISEVVLRLFMVIGFGIGSGCGILLANSLGAKEFEKAKVYARKCLLIVVPVSMVMASLLILFSPIIVGIYDVSPAVREMAAKNLLVVAFALILKNYNYATIVGILRSGGDTKYCLFLDMAGVWFVGVPMAFIGAYLLKWPIYFVLILVSLEEVFKFILSTKRVLSDVWVRNIVS